ncbi:MAG TPA: hypothetical protein VGX94_11930 [Terriglobia bacterium]|nr:hypothetical protein [Terriglobia bacterium]
MRADQVEVLWDDKKNKWTIRIQAGDEVIHRPCDLPKDATEQALSAAAGTTLRDEGYEAETARVAVRR